MPAADSLAGLARLLGAPPPEAEQEPADVVREWLADPADLAESASPESEPLRRGLATLEPRQRAVVVLRYWSGLSVAEVAELLERPEETVELETAAALDVLATDEERLAAELAELAADPWPEEDVEPAPRRWRSVGVAAGVLLVAGVFAAVLGLGEPASAPPNDSSWSPPPTDPSATGAPGPPPSVGNSAAAIDNRARRLTAQLAKARSRVLAGVDVAPIAVSTTYGSEPWEPLVFHVADTPDLYLAVALLGAGHDAALLKIDVGRRDPDSDPRYTPCPEFQLDCTYRRFPDGTYGAVSVFSEPETDHTVHRLTAMRPNGTFLHATVYYVEARSDPPPLDVADLFRFATVLNY